MMKSYLDVLEETVKIYSEDTSRRAWNGSSCLFYDKETGNKCALGRYIKNVEELMEKHPELNENDLNSVLSEFNHSFDFLTDDVVHLTNKRFWSHLQNLHDTPTYWNNNGLTELGSIKHKELEKKCLTQFYTDYGLNN